jgi:hypothetical protein
MALLVSWFWFSVGPVGLAGKGKEAVMAGFREGWYWVEIGSSGYRDFNYVKVEDGYFAAGNARPDGSLFQGRGILSGGEKLFSEREGGEAAFVLPLNLERS